MAIRVTREPYEISLANNPIIYSLQASNALQETDVFPKLTLTFIKKAKAGDGFRFHFIDIESGLPVFFSCHAAVTVDTEGLLYPDESFVGTLADYTLATYNQLKKNIHLNSFFELSTSGVTITFTARFAKADLTPTNVEEIQFDDLGVPFDHLSLVVSENYLEANRRTNYRVLLNVFIELVYESGVYVKVATLKDEPDISGLANFDISSVLASEIKNSFTQIPAPTLSSNDIFVSNNIRNYFVSWCEYYDGQPTDLFWIQDQKKIVHTGGVSTEDWAKQNPFTFIFTKKQFLTWQPNNKTLIDVQNDWLTFINFKNAVHIFTTRIKVYFTDGTNSGHINIAVKNLQPWEEICIPVGYKQRDIATIAGVKEAYKWEIDVLDEVGAVSEVRTFYRLLGPYIQMSELMYLNAFGCPETFLTTGVWEEKLLVTKQYIERALSINYTLINGQEFQFDQTSKISYEVNTGYMTKEFISGLKDIITRTDVFLLENTEYIPVLISPGTFEISSSMEFLKQLKLAIRRSFRVDNYSNEVRIPVFTAVLDCGIVGFSVDDNLRTVAAYGTMKVSYNGSVLYAALSYTSGVYYFTSVQTPEGNYRIEVNITLSDGEVISYDFNYYLRHQKAFIDTEVLGGIAFNVSTAASTTDVWYVNWGVGVLVDDYTITSGPSFVSEVVNHHGNKRLEISSLCAERVEKINMYDQPIQFDLTAFFNLKSLRFSYSTMQGVLDLTPFKKLEEVRIFGNDLTSIQIGFHPNILEIDCNSNQLPAEAIEAMLVELWNYRKFYSTITKVINVAGNPGAGGSMSATALAIINGTGAYTGEGLATDYTFSVIY